MNVAEFVAKWRKVDLKERSAAQEHFLDLCRLVGHPTPAEADPTGATFCFEKGAAKHGGGEGFVDVWKQAFFEGEYKGRHKDIEAAFDQLLLYKDAGGNPPLLFVCDMDRIVIRTNFTGTVPVTHDILLEELGDPRNLEILHHLFFDPEKLKPGKTSEAVTQDAADRFAGIADSMRARGLDAAHVAHFLDRIVFCLFAEDIGLLPDQIFTRMVDKAAGDPAKFCRFIGQLFDAMAHGGEFGLESIRHFNGSLFDNASCPQLASEEVKRIADTSRLDWSAVDPTIFGTLFQRGLDPALRAQLGAHFTGRADIEDVVENVIMRPLRVEWAETKATIEGLLATGQKTCASATSPLWGEVGDAKRSRVRGRPSAKKVAGESISILHRFLVRLQSLKVLDPACGSGNFLYVTLLKLKDLEKEVILFAMDHGLGGFLPMVGPWQLYGIEKNPYAHDLAQMTVWIGWLQWIRFNGFGQPQEPILRPMTGNFRCTDAILDLTDPTNPREPDWPKADFIVGNPPFLGGKKLRRELGDEYVDKLLRVWADRVPAEADLCCYWFEKARSQIEAGHCRRAGLLATQRIRTGANREILQRLQAHGGIFWAVSDRDWILDGANVHVSMVGFDNGDDESRTLDGHTVTAINANLSSAADVAAARRLDGNRGIAFMGDTKVGPFEIPEATARAWLSLRNPNGRPNGDVVRPWANGLEITRTPQGLWIVDFPPGTTETEAASYEAPFEYIKEHVRPMRERSRAKGEWWIHERPRPDMRRAIDGLPRYIVTPCVSKHRIFAWLPAGVLPDHQLIVFARSDDFFFGVLHSRPHAEWALATCGRLETRPQYTPTTSFETFPLPVATPDQQTAIAAAAKALDDARRNWLGDRSDKTRTLTNLYNQRPTWLADAHRRLDEAVFAAYGWPADLNDGQILERLLELNLTRTREEERHP